MRGRGRAGCGGDGQDLADADQEHESRTASPARQCRSRRPARNSVPVALGGHRLLRRQYGLTIDRQVAACVELGLAMTVSCIHNALGRTTFRPVLMFPYRRPGPSGRKHRGLRCRVTSIWSAACRAKARPRCSRRSARRSARGCKRIPDGETGERADWIIWLEPVFADSPALEKSDEVFRLHATATPRIRYRLKPGRLAADVRVRQPVLRRYRRALVPRLRAAQARRQNPGALPLPDRSGAGAFGDLACSCRTTCMRRSIPIYNEALKREIDKIAARLPHDRDRDPVRCRVGGVRAARAQRRVELRPQQGRNAADLRAHPDRSRQPRAAATSSCCFISAMAIPTTGMWSSRPTWPTWWRWRTGWPTASRGRSS